MPRADPEWNRRAIRAYHRASAALRDLHREEWEALRAGFLDSTDPVEKQPPGPARGNKAQVAAYRPVTPGDLQVAREVIAELLAKPKTTPARVLETLSRAGFVLLRSTDRKHQPKRLRSAG